jgi:ABC-type uncharacterized transport system substrate-binding protein
MPIRTVPRLAFAVACAKVRSTARKGGKMAIRQAFLAVGVGLAPLPALAHPHVFIDATVEVMFDEAGLATGLRIGWTYDDFFSMMIIEDRALDPDYDAVLTPEAVAALSGFDMQWDPDFPGDTYAFLQDRALPLQRPTDWSADYADGKITSTHVRRFEAPVPVADQPLVVKVYDPGFYTAYAVVGTPAIIGRDDCAVEVFTPDTDAADEALLALLAQMPTTADIEVAYPEVGASYAQDIRITCNARS